MGQLMLLDSPDARELNHRVAHRQLLGRKLEP
jgi:hypothetical protein